MKPGIVTAGLIAGLLNAAVLTLEKYLWVEPGLLTNLIVALYIGYFVGKAYAMTTKDP